jgi:hypothetical protein
LLLVVEAQGFAALGFVFLGVVAVSRLFEMHSGLQLTADNFQRFFLFAPRVPIVPAVAAGRKLRRFWAAQTASSRRRV